MGLPSLLEIWLLTSCGPASCCLKDLTCLTALLMHFVFCLEHLAEKFTMYLVFVDCTRIHFGELRTRLCCLLKCLDVVMVSAIQHAEA